jgi:UDP-glucose 4-epimerase
VLYTRASVVPFFIDLMKKGKPLVVTNRNMTRFMMTLEESIDLVFYALANGKNGEIYVRKSSASTVGDLVDALVALFKYTGGTKEIGSRPGEKLHEALVSVEEAPRTEDCGSYYKINPEVPDMDMKKYYSMGDGNDSVLPPEGYTSVNTKRLSVEEITTLLLSLPGVQEELKNFKN